jgi:hypothetical protein
MPTTISRPSADEYLAYYERYITLVPEGNLVDILTEQHRDTMRMLRSVGDERGLYAYAPGKWTIKEVIGHLSDAERIFAYRALRFARGDAQPVAGFDENAYVPAGRFNERPIGDLADEFQAIRSATVHLFRHLDEEEMARRGVANSNPISVRALGFVIAGHERHHAKLLRERYGIGG